MYETVKNKLIKMQKKQGDKIVFNVNTTTIIRYIVTNINESEYRFKKTYKVTQSI